MNAVQRRTALTALLLGLLATACSDGRSSTSSATVTSVAPSSTLISTTTAAPTTVTPTTAAPSIAQGVLPAVSGPHAVGVAELGVASATVWYPTDAPPGPTRPYVSEQTAAATGVDVSINEAVRTHGIVGAAPATGAPRPVVVLLPGFGSPIELSTVLAEHLASNDMVVVAIPVDLATESQSELPTEADRDHRYASVRAVLDAVGDGTLANVAGAIDPARVAVGGHSFAGSNAVNLALADRRIAAAFDLDGTLFDAAATEPLDRPALLLLSEASLPSFATMSATLLERAPKTTVVALSNSAHFDFTDGPVLAAALGPDVVPLELGTVGPKATSVAAQVVGRFLDAAFSGRAVDSTELAALDPALVAVGRDWMPAAAR